MLRLCMYFLLIFFRKYLQAKKQMLLKLEKLKPDGNLYQSHRRVILKEYVEQLRADNAKYKE